MSSTPPTGEKGSVASSYATGVSLRMKRQSARVWSLPRSATLCTFLAALSRWDGARRVRETLSRDCRVGVSCSVILSRRRRGRRLRRVMEVVFSLVFERVGIGSCCMRSLQNPDLFEDPESRPHSVGTPFNPSTTTLAAHIHAAGVAAPRSVEVFLIYGTDRTQ